MSEFTTLDTGRGTQASTVEGNGGLVDTETHLSATGEKLPTTLICAHNSAIISDEFRSL